jgi:predicted glutamine amidotransferase
MCRLFGQLSPAPKSAADCLVISDFSLLAQSNSDKDNLQADGWGLGWFGEEGKPLVSKSPQAVFREAARFREAADQARGTAVVGHIRSASNPRCLPRGELITLDNTQPFTDGRWVFAHNGTLQIPLEVAARLGSLRDKLKAKNDSEVYFWQFIKFQRQLKDASAAFSACVQEIWDVWERAKPSGKASPYTSLNAIASDGKSLHAFCHSIAAGAAEHAIFNAGRPWQQMSWRLQDARLLVASEDLDRGPGWNRLGPDESLSAVIEDSALRVDRRPFHAPVARR